MKVAVVSLGCAKNLVDSETLLAKLEESGAKLTADINSADVVVVNTCGFIEEAKEESLQTVSHILSAGKRVIVIGCLVERYKEELKKSLPQVEAFFGTESWEEVVYSLDLKAKRKGKKRLLSTAGYAYVKVGEGCNRLCSFCTIPAIRGRYRSRSVEDIVSEVISLTEEGIKEINLISQDTTYYGKDNGENLVKLLEKLERIKGIHWIRLLYLYPAEVSEDLISFIKNSQKVLPYFDIPLQHISDRILKSMRRGYNEKFIRNLIYKIRKEIPQAVLRTTFIVGYPLEEEKDFLRLLSFVEEGHFHWLGVFAYSAEKGTYAYDLGDPIPPSVKEERGEELINLQRKISADKNREFIGKTLEVLVEGYCDENPFIPQGRAYLHAPEVDGFVYIDTKGKQIKKGDMVKVLINQSSDYDLGGVLIK